MAGQGTGLAHAEYDEPGGLSYLAGWGVRAAGVAGIITDAQVVAATSAEDLEVIVEAALPGTVHAENEITQLMCDRALKFGDALGDYSDARVAASTGYENLAEKTAVSDDPDTGHLGPRII